MPHYDAIVIGSGQAGNPLSQKLADRGWAVAAPVEKEYLGGTCVSTGCTPTKDDDCLGSVARRRNADRWGVRARRGSACSPKVVARKDRVVEQSRGLNRKVEERRTLHLYLGVARRPHEVRVGEEVLESERIFIDTGTRSDVPHLEGLNGIEFLDNSSIMRLAEVPEHLIVLGGGYIGMEFGQMFRRFGNNVTVVQRDGAVLTRGRRCRRSLATSPGRRGLRFLLDATTTPRREGAGWSHPECGSGGKHGDGARVPPAGRPGREPNTDDLVSRPGCRPINGGSSGEQPAGDRQAGVWALGDVKGGPAFTHISFSDTRSCMPTWLMANPHHRQPPGPLRRLHRPPAGPRRADQRGREARRRGDGSRSARSRWPGRPRCRAH